MKPKTTRQIHDRPDPPAPTRAPQSRPRWTGSGISKGGSTPPPRRGPDAHGVVVAALLLILLALLVWALAPRTAFAHGWYDEACCSDRDCAPLPAGSVVPVESGWRITLPPGAHPFVQSTAPFLVPYAPAGGFDPQIRPSRDGRFHLCASETMLICLYVPEFGA